MLEQAVHVWDLLLWLKGEPPSRAFGGGRRDIFAHLQPSRDVTDWYSVHLEWPDSFRASFVQSWVDPADDAFPGTTQRILGTSGGFDFSSGVLTYRDRSKTRQVIQPGHLPETTLALDAFARSIRSGGSLEPPVSLSDARDATRLGLMVRLAVDERRVVEWGEVT
jgi:predicted dehydrogenase